MKLRRLPLLAVLLTALCAAPGAYAQSKPAPGSDRQTVLPVWNKGSGKVEAVLLLEPTGQAGPGARTACSPASGRTIRPAAPLAA